MSKAQQRKARSFAPDRYDKMPYRRCGRSGLMLPSISLGLWQTLGDTGNASLCRKCCYWAFDHGVTHFDLANNYGSPPGNSEKVFGRIIRDMPRDELIVSTKAGFPMWPGPYGNWGSRKHLIASLDQSLKRLGLQYVDIFYHHRQDPDTPLEETLAALDQIVRSGKALYAGVSNYRSERFLEAVGVAAEHNLAPITIHQTKYNMLNRNIESGLLEQASAAGTGTIVYSVLDKGRLSDRYLRGIPKGSRMAKAGRAGREYYKQMKASGLLERISRLNELARSRGQSLAQMAITWALRDEKVTSVLVGVSSVQQLKDNLAALGAAPLTQDELARIDSILES